MKKRVIDLSFPITHEMPTYPHDPSVGLVRLKWAEVEGYKLTAILMGTHTGTHVDSPCDLPGHPAEKKDLSQLDLEKFIGEALVINLPRGPLGEITADDLRKYSKEIQEVKRVILNSGWHKKWDTPDYFFKFPGISVDAAQLLADLGIWLLGIDMPSLNKASREVNHAAHRILLGKEVVLLETMANLSALKKSRVFLSALPLKIESRSPDHFIDGAPVRAIAIEEG